jgi:L-rhamnonate dehydratase
VLQPDIYWAGGRPEVLKIAAYASVHDLLVIPYGHSTPAGLHFSLAHPITPLHGEFALPTLPGLGMHLDPAKIEAQTEV